MTNAINKIKQTIDGFTMYKIMFFSLGVLVVFSFIFSAFNLLHFSISELCLSFITIFIIGIVSHFILQKIFESPANLESTIISLLILFLIIAPTLKIRELFFIALTSFLIIVGKYIFVYKNRHIFNPVALAIFIISFLNYNGIIWWIGNKFMLPIVLIAGIIILLKIRKIKEFLFFITLTSIISFLHFAFLINNFSGQLFVDNLSVIFLSYPLIFFASFMLIEPLGMPGTKKMQYIFMIIIAIFFSIPLNIKNYVHGTPELALLIGNLFTFLINFPKRLTLKFIEKKEVAKNTFEYNFQSNYKLDFTAGQYLEWTLPHNNKDNRGIKRFFTISSSPNLMQKENKISFTVKHLPTQSSYKNTLEKIKINDKMFASLLGGDFTIKNINNKNVFIAGGIGITPFISIIRENKINFNNITLFYAVNNLEDIAFKNELEIAKNKGMKIVYIINNNLEKNNIKDNSNYEFGIINNEIILKHCNPVVIDYFYISGPTIMVDICKNNLLNAKIENKKIITDFFPGLA